MTDVVSCSVSQQTDCRERSPLSAMFPENDSKHDYIYIAHVIIIIVTLQLIEASKCHVVLVSVLVRLWADCDLIRSLSTALSAAFLGKANIFSYVAQNSVFSERKTCGEIKFSSFDILIMETRVPFYSSYLRNLTVAKSLKCK